MTHTLQRMAVDGDDLDEAKALYENGYNGSGFRVERTELDFGYRYSIAGDADMTFRSSSFLGSIKGRLEPNDEYIVSWLHTGTASLSVGGEVVDWVGCTPWLFPTGTPFDFDSRDYRQSLIAFRGGYFEQVAAEEGATSGGPVLFQYAEVPGTAELLQWKQVVEEAARLVLQGKPTKLQMSQISRRTAVALLDCFPHVRLDPPREALLPHTGRLRTAVDFVHAHAHQTVTPTELAEAAGLSLRGLQQAFRRRLGLTPTAYLRQVRLDRAHDELLALTPHETTVGAVSAAWGFTHFGRFSIAYRARFGESPRDTLRR